MSVSTSGGWAVTPPCRCVLPIPAVTVRKSRGDDGREFPTLGGGGTHRIGRVAHPSTRKRIGLILIAKRHFD